MAVYLGLLSSARAGDRRHIYSSLCTEPSTRGFHGMKINTEYHSGKELLLKLTAFSTPQHKM